MYHSTDLLTVRGVAHLVVHGTSGSTSYETIPHVQLEISGDVLWTADMVVQRRDGPRRLREIDDDDDDDEVTSRYDRHAVGITWHDVRSQKAKNYGVVYIKLNQLVYENVHTITSLPIKRI